MAPEIAVQDNSTSNDRGDCNMSYQCKMVGGDFIEGDNNGREFLCGGASLLGGDVAL